MFSPSSQHCFVSPRVSASRVLLLVSLALLVGSPASAFIGDVAFNVTPQAPNSAEAILVQVTGISVPTAAVEFVEIDGNVVTIQVDDTCFGLCPAEGFSFDVNVGPLEAGDYDIRLTDVFGTEVAKTEVQVTVAPLDGLLVRSHIEPADPNDNELLRVLVTGLTCETLELDSTTVDGQTIEIRGTLGNSGCSSVVTETSAFSASVGPLEAGDYDVKVLLLDAAAPDAGYQTASTQQVRIGDAEDAVGLRGNRFQVRVDWKAHGGETGVGRPVPGASESTTLFSFFERDNWELMVKVLDGCALNDHYWVFTAASTDVEYTLEVTDTSTGQVRTYTNQLGERAPATTDVEAFATCP